jgi:hypothetical protein
MASVDTRARQLLDVETELFDQTRAFGDFHRVPTLGQHRERRRAGVSRDSRVDHPARLTPSCDNETSRGTCA